ncbi:DinB family protein [Neorhodopirellula pilleata]|uniref:DinB superfamily protein n=1 Tax=Neorhodopirellula pilleata TaxID=2714738 RepID=A0A5C6APE1_9BACT|nr:DinB family protein [Neorhodopirellula pilleata]TWU01550.1 DinB superfamily protein [Neorhodopirellula pilleata]
MNVIPTAESPSPIMPTVDEAATMLQAAIGQIEWARAYTLELLAATPRELWCQSPAGLPTHVAWQVGHLAVSQYGLLMFRMRGRRPEDLELIPGKLRKTYGRGGTPPAGGDGAFSPDELFDKLAEVHRLAMDEITMIEPQMLLEPVDMPYAVYPCKLGAVLFCPMHESLHAGQIGVLRRGLGLEPIR